MGCSLIRAAIHLLENVEKVINKIRGNRSLQLLINVTLVAFTVVYMGSYIIRQWSELQNLQLSFDILKFLSSIVVFGVNIGLFIIAWHIIIQLFESKNSFTSNALVYSATLAARLLPTPAWYLAGRVYYYREQIGKRAALIATVSETVLHAWVGLVIYCLLSIHINQLITWIFLAVAIVFTVILLIIIRSYLHRNYAGLSATSFLSRLAVVVLAFIATWGGGVIFFNFILHSLFTQIFIPWIELSKIWVVSTIFAYISSYTLGGIGFIREFSLIFLLAVYLSPPQCVAVAVLSRFAMIIGSLIWASLIYLVSRIILHYNPSL